MDKKKIKQIKESLDLVIQKDNENEIEFWYARDFVNPKKDFHRIYMREV